MRESLLRTTEHCALYSRVNAAPQLDKLLADAEAALAKQSNITAVEQLVVAVLRRANEQSKLAPQKERIYMESCGVKTDD